MSGDCVNLAHHQKAPALERLLDLLAEELVERYLIEVGMKETATHDDRD